MCQEQTAHQFGLKAFQTWW